MQQLIFFLTSNPLPFPPDPMKGRWFTVEISGGLRCGRHGEHEGIKAVWVGLDSVDSSVSLLTPRERLRLPYIFVVSTSVG